MSVQPGLGGSNDLRVGRKMATFQLFFQSGRAKDLSAPLYVCVYVCKYTLYRKVLGPWSPHSITADPETACCNHTNMAMTAEEKEKDKGGWEQIV